MAKLLLFVFDLRFEVGRCDLTLNFASKCVEVTAPVFFF